MVLALSSQRLYHMDEARVRLNQNLNAAKDFLVTDVLQAGERLPATFPAIEIVRGEDLPGGAAGDPDRLVVRRNLLDTSMRSCRDVDDTDPVTIAELDVAPPPGCVAVPDDNADGWPDNQGTWRTYRLVEGRAVEGEQAVRAYIYNPTNGEGEFFWYWGEDAGEGTLVPPPTHVWQNVYPAADGCQVFILEERQYEIVDGTLTLQVDRDPDETFNVVASLEDFQVRALFQVPPPPAAQVEPAPSESFGFGDDWSTLRAIELSVAGSVAYRDRDIDGSWRAEVMPRNVSSR
jgi:hypothetical protein